MTFSELLKNLPPLPDKDLVSEIHDLLRESKKTLVVLDEDPSGTQSVFDVPVITDLSPQAIRDAIDEAPPVIFLLTNSRDLTAEASAALHQELGGTLKEFEDDIIVISRSSSSLPLTDTLREALGIPDAPTLLIPFCETQNQITIGDTHYQIEAEDVTPLPLPDREFQSISIEDLRTGDPAEKLASLPAGSTCLINAASLRDLNALSLSLLKSDRRFIIRSGSSFVQSLAGIVSRPPLDAWQMQDLDPNPNGGLIVVGSNVPKTSAQLTHLLKNAPDTVPLELNVAALLESPDETLFPLSAKLNQTIESGKTALLFTSRDSITPPDDASQRALSDTISRALVSLVQSVIARPSFFIAKGGQTASDIATDALGVKEAMALGQILPGVPVWTLGNETRHPGLAYVIFPGNVGSDDALTQAYEKLTP
ncbi:MAG: nucleotide-binding domain containing protein [Akkermansiaceae bacterium]